MRYIWRIFLIMTVWPGIILVYLLGITLVNILMFAWYTDFKHFHKIDNFWFPIDTNGSEIEWINSEGKDFDHKWVRYEEYYKTPSDLFLDRRHRIYPDGNN